jgi:UPF0716 protein FxsA
MRLVVFLALAAIPILEIALLVKLGQWLGVFATILLVLGTAVLGTYVLHRQGFKVLSRVMDSINAGKTPVGPAVDGAFLMAAGGLLIAPGIITDTIGLLLLIPQLRHRIAAWSVRRFLRSAVVRSETFTRTTYKARADQGWPGGQPGSAGADHSPSDAGPVIDGEFERIDERTIDPRKSSQSGSTQSGSTQSGQQTTSSASQRPQTNGARPPGERPADRV